MAQPGDAENLPGYKKKSFMLPYNGGEIWFEHLDGIYNNEDLVLKKLESDIPLFSKPSSTSYICFVLDETEVTDRVLAAVVNSILENPKSFMRVAFSGIDRKSKHRLKHELSDKGFAIGFFDGLEDAKEWLLHGCRKAGMSYIHLLKSVFRRLQGFSPAVFRFSTA